MTPTTSTKREPSPQQLQATLTRMRQRLVFASWPASLDDAMAEPWRARLIRLTARSMATPQPAGEIHRCGRRTTQPAPLSMTTPPSIDRKRLASGDFD